MKKAASTPQKQECTIMDKGTCGYKRSIKCPVVRSDNLSDINNKLDIIIHMLSQKPGSARKPFKDYAQWVNSIADQLMNKYAKDPEKAIANFYKTEKEIGIATAKRPKPQSPPPPKPKRRITPIPI